MGKLEPIDGKQTKWLGLWWNPEYNGYSSTVLSLADIRKFKGNVRLYVRKNKFFNKGENNRPNYCFTLKDANAEVFNLLEVEEEEDREDDDVYKDKEGNRLYTEDEVYRVIHGMENYHGLPYGDDLISDFI